MIVQMRPIGSIRPYENNPRNNDGAVEAVIRSIREYGWRQPIVVDSDGIIIVGHTRHKAAIAMGLQEVPVHVAADLPPEKARAYRIADNRVGELAEWEPQALSSELAALEALGVEMDALGWEPDDLREAMGKDTEIVEDEPPAPLPDPVSKTGDLWILGEHRLLCGDSTKGEAIDALMNGQLIDLCVTYPPYNCDIEYLSHDDTMPEGEYLAFIRAIVNNAVSRLGKGRFIAWNVGVTPKSMHFQHAQALNDAGLQFWRQIVWAKAGVAFPIWQYTTAARKYHPNYTHEVIFLFSNGMPLAGGTCEVDDVYSKDVWQIHQSSATRDIPGETNGRKPRNDEHGGSKAAAHPAAYPIGIPAGCIKHLTARAENVYEPFSGSGTTMIACQQLGRKCYGIEIEPIYVDVAIRRWQKLTGAQATLDGTNKTWAAVAKKRGVKIDEPESGTAPNG